jgi:hypothetical protein
MRPLSESVAGLTLVGLAALCAAIGVAANVAGFSIDETWFLAALLLGILALAVAVDEQRLTNMPPVHRGEAWLARGVMGLALACGATGFILGLIEDDNRNLWGLMAIIIGLLAVSFAMDAHRVAVARHSVLEMRHDRDALGGVLCAALGFGVGVFGLFTGLFGLPHPEAWLFAGVVFAVLSAAFMFDEQVQAVHRARRTEHRPFGSSRS